MRLALCGYSGPPGPVTLVLQNGSDFSKAEYVAQGFDRFDVIAIGASGGFGGVMFGTDSDDGASNYRYCYFGGAPGGGGMHRVMGLLSGLPDLAPVVVGSAGADGVDGYDRTIVTAGADGGYSSFNGAMCVASGGKGGQKSGAGAIDEQGIGGAGGLGTTATAGGGGTGGQCAHGDFESGEPVSATNGAEGGWNGVYGGGAGGGGGGTYLRFSEDGSEFRRNATAGGLGQWNPTETSVFGPRGYETVSPKNADYTAPVDWVSRPGAGGGSKATPLNFKNDSYGSRAPESDPNGFVVIRLYTI